MNYKDVNDYEVCYLIRENEDDDALELILKKYDPVIRRICTKYYERYKGICIDFEDLNQEAKIGLMKALKSYNEKDSMFYTYVNLCIERQLISYCRNYNNLKNYALNFSTRDIMNRTSAKMIENNNLELILIENERFLECKNFLKFNHSIVFELRYNNFSYKEIAQLLDIPISTVDGRIRLIRKTLKNDLNIGF